MTKQEFYLQAAAMIAAQLHSNNSAFDDGEECNINTYAVSAASNLLKEVQTEWDNRSKNAKTYGALFQP